MQRCIVVLISILVKEYYRGVGVPVEMPKRTTKRTHTLSVGVYPYGDCSRTDDIRG
jgi:hypothetical protein